MGRPPIPGRRQERGARLRRAVLQQRVLRLAPERQANLQQVALRAPRGQPRPELRQVVLPALARQPAAPPRAARPRAERRPRERRPAGALAARVAAPPMVALQPEPTAERSAVTASKRTSTGCAS